MTEKGITSLYNFLTIIRKHWLIVVSTFLLVTCFFVCIYSGMRRAYIEQARRLARFTAVCIAARIDPKDLDAIKKPKDFTNETYKKLQNILINFHDSAEMVRYAWIMRRSTVPGAKPSDYEFVVDLPSTDENMNGVIDDDEKTDLPGTRYDASPYPALINAWNVADADDKIYPDPPRPPLLSGYAPIRDEQGKTVAVAGADVTADDIERQLFAVRALVLASGMILAVMFSAVIVLYCNRRDMLQHISEMNLELQNKNRQLEEAATLRNDLSNMIVHDMRNHMTIVSGYSSLLRDSFRPSQKTQDKERDEIWTQLETAIKQLTDFMQDMLVLAKSESGKLLPHFHNINFNEIVTESVKCCDSIAKISRVPLVTRLPDKQIEACADKHLLSRVMDNLILNAIKHTEPPGKVLITLDTFRSESGQDNIQITIIDEGTGVPPEIKDNLFKKYHSGDSSTAATKAIGLGLAFCKMAIEEHNGKIYLKDSPKGAIFVVELPWRNDCPLPPSSFRSRQKS